jgi:hypothetical protein
MAALEVLIAIIPSRSHHARSCGSMLIRSSRPRPASTASRTDASSASPIAGGASPVTSVIRSASSQLPLT